LRNWFKYVYNVATHQQSAVFEFSTDHYLKTNPENYFCEKVQIEEALEKLPLRLRKIIYLYFVLGIPVAKICTLLGYKFRVNFYRKLDECFENLYDIIGDNFLYSFFDK